MERKGIAMTRKWISLLVGISLLLSCRLSADLGTAPATAADSSPAETETFAETLLELLSIPTDEPSTITADSTVLYSDLPASDPNLLSLDIYPSGRINSPVMIYVHGGGWQTGDKVNVYIKPAAFNEQGFVFVSVNYRLAPEVTVKDEAGDVARAVAWVKNNITLYGGDPAQIWLMGHSAGAHLVSLVGTDESLLQAAGANLSDLQGVISLDTQAYDLPKLLKSTSGALRNKIAILFGKSIESWIELSPASHIEAGKSIPPFLIVYSGDAQARGDLAEVFMKKLLSAGVDAQILPATDKNHGQVNLEIGLEGSYVSTAVFDFVTP